MNHQKFFFIFGWDVSSWSLFGHHLRSKISKETQRKSFAVALCKQSKKVWVKIKVILNLARYIRILKMTNKNF